jgi:hypothetical protein
VAHASNRLDAAAGPLVEVSPPEIDDLALFHLMLDATDLDTKTAEAVLGFVSALVGRLDAEARANVLELPREVSTMRRDFIAVREADSLLPSTPR